MRTILPIITLLAVGLAVPTTDDGWAEFKAQHGKVYSDPEEDQRRREIFLNAKVDVEEHNAKYANGEVTYEKAVNHLSDLLPEEMIGLIVPEDLAQGINGYHEASGEDIPDSIDWREENAVTHVKDQRHCGSCYAFSATGALEGQIAINTGNLVSLSEQEIVDCHFHGAYGCKGGSPGAVFDSLNVKSHRYPRSPKGLETEENYPYTGRRGPCAWNESSESAVTVLGRKYVKPTEDDLKEAVATVGPISVAIHDNLHFHLYRRGIFHDHRCNRHRKLHLVLVVGYGSEDGQDYWIVKNSWGTGWGEEGYIRMARNTGGHGMCGIARYPVYPIV